MGWRRPCWRRFGGFLWLDPSAPPQIRHYILQAAYFVLFCFVFCGAARLARFNITTNPVPRNPGRPDKKYFVGLPIPAAAGMVAAVVYAANSEPLVAWPFVVAWILLLAILSALMVSAWRYRSFKDLSLVSPRSPFSIVRFAMVIYLLINFSQAVLLALALTYVGSGVVVRIGGILRRKLHPEAHPKPPEEPRAA